MENHYSECDFKQISVVISVRNRAHFLKRCLSSLTAQHIDAQYYEIIICDDGSTEDIASVVKKNQPGPPIVRLLQQSPQGPAAARNLGIRGSLAPIIIFLDSDVIPDHDLIGILLAALNQNPGWMGAEACIKPIGGKESPLWDGPVCHNGGRYHTAAIAYRREALIEGGGFDETFRLPACEDVELAVRILAQGTIGYVPEAVVYHPMRRVTFRTHWHWRRHWKYEMILAKRYGFLSFPGNPTGPFPRFRVALAAVVTLPTGRFIEGLKYMKHKPLEGMLACLYALFNVFCGLWVLPIILFSRVPSRRDYLFIQRKDIGQ